MMIVGGSGESAMLETTLAGHRAWLSPAETCSGPQSVVNQCRGTTTHVLVTVAPL